MQRVHPVLAAAFLCLTALVLAPSQPAKARTNMGSSQAPQPKTQSLVSNATVTHAVPTWTSPAIDARGYGYVSFHLQGSNRADFAVFILGRNDPSEPFTRIQRIPVPNRSARAAPTPGMINFRMSTQQAKACYLEFGDLHAAEIAFEVQLLNNPSPQGAQSLTFKASAYLE